MSSRGEVYMEASPGVLGELLARKQFVRRLTDGQLFAVPRTGTHFSGKGVNQELLLDGSHVTRRERRITLDGVNQTTLKKARILLLFGTSTAFPAWNPAAAQGLPSSVKIFDLNPNHIWNKTYACLFVRRTSDGTEYGADALDPLLWDQTQHLLNGDSHRRALECLDVFLRSHAENAEQNPLKRAILQRDLWAIFDWAAAGQTLPQQRRELEVRLAAAIRRLAITPEQARRLPDTYSEAVAGQEFARDYDPQNSRQPFLPPELFRPDGPWVCISGYSDEPTAFAHFSGRSRFLVFMRLPGGRDATLAYVDKLRSSREPPLLMQFPAGTAVALVRQMIVIDNQGKLTATALTESVQLRVYHSVNYSNSPSSHGQDFFAFQMRRPGLFAKHSGGLVAVRPGETEFATFRTHGIDAFESTPPLDKQDVVLERCFACHSNPGILQVQSRLQWMKPSPRLDGKNDDPIAWETDVTIRRKQQQSDFNLLLDSWKPSPD